MEENHELELAWQVIENTGTHLFLTGKAGTGKNNLPSSVKGINSQTHGSGRSYGDCCH